MDKTEQLFIRACKSKSPEQRVLSVYRRFYMVPQESVSYEYIAQILARICDEYKLFNTLDLLTDLNPENRWKYNLKNDVSYSRFCMRVLVGKIRFAKVNKLQGLSVAASFRNAA